MNCIMKRRNKWVSMRNNNELHSGKLTWQFNRHHPFPTGHTSTNGACSIAIFDSLWVHIWFLPKRKHGDDHPAKKLVITVKHPKDVNNLCSYIQSVCSTHIPTRLRQCPFAIVTWPPWATRLPPAALPAAAREHRQRQERCWVVAPRGYAWMIIPVNN